MSKAQARPIPQVVVFNAFGRSLPALVLSARYGEVSHLGADGEPLLTLAVKDPARESGLTKDKETGEFIYPVGRIPQIFIEHDVVHESHEFDAEFKKQHGSSPNEILSQRGHGEWSEYVDEEDRDLVDKLRASLSDSRAAVLDANREAADARGERDIERSKREQLSKELAAAKAAKTE